MKEALFYKKLKDGMVRCELCPHFCTLKNAQRGKCGVRENQEGKLLTLVYEKPCSKAIDPIEKKPLFHFFPGDKCLSIATVGCNLKCSNCQNWQISQASKIEGKNMPASEVIRLAEENGIKIIAYTYTEPTIFFEYMLEIAKLANKKGIKNVIVSNGFINPEPLQELCKYINAANIDIKSINEKFYEKVCSGRLAPILEALKILKKENVWTEVTNLVIPGMNDDPEEIKKLSCWIKQNLGGEVPLHFSAFRPMYKMTDIEATQKSKLADARKIALGAGLKYVYIGNVIHEEGECTFCPKCRTCLIKRGVFLTSENNIKNGRCNKCNEKIEGIWD